jgi:hypothetical protein
MMNWLLKISVMKNFVLIFLVAITFCGCANVQTQSVSENKPQSTPTISNTNTGGEHYGYPRFTTSDKQYLGCWRSIEASEVINYELKFFRITEKRIQTSKMPEPIDYKEVESNGYKDYFVLQTESKKKEIQPYLSINIVSENEMTVHEFAAKKDIKNGDGENYWNLKREDCEKISSKFRK